MRNSAVPSAGSAKTFKTKTDQRVYPSSTPLDGNLVLVLWFCVYKLHRVLSCHHGNSAVTAAPRLSCYLSCLAEYRALLSRRSRCVLMDGRERTCNSRNPGVTSVIVVPQSSL